MLLNEMEIFYRVVSLGSFSKAAEQLGVSKAFISKHITKLEQGLDAKLLTRTTRQLRLTQAGETYFQYCEKIVADAAAANASLTELKGRPSGLLRVSVPPAVGNLLADFIPKFLQQYPDMQVDMQLQSHLVDLVKDNFDCVLRAAKLEDSNLIAQPLKTFEQHFYATNQYFKQYGIPKKIEDLFQHKLIVYSVSTKPRLLTLTMNNKRIKIPGYCYSNHLSLIKTLVINHCGIGLFPLYMVTQELKTNNLISCLDDIKLPTGTLYAIYLERELMPLKLRVFLQALKAFFQ